MHRDYVEIDLAILGKAGFIIVLAIWGAWGALSENAFAPLHAVDLCIHEVGHLLFGIFGSETLMVMGGTLLQLAMPVAFTIYFARRNEYYSGAVVLFWLAQNFFDVAVYMCDARALALPLVSIGAGEGDVIHDWNYLFDRWGVLGSDIMIAHIVSGIGWGLLLVMLIAGLYFSFTNTLPSFTPIADNPPPQPPRRFKFE